MFDNTLLRSSFNNSQELLLTNEWPLLQTFALHDDVGEFDQYR